MDKLEKLSAMSSRLHTAHLLKEAGLFSMIGKGVKGVASFATKNPKTSIGLALGGTASANTAVGEARKIRTGFNPTGA